MKKSYLFSAFLILLIALLFWQTFGQGNRPDTSLPAPNPVSAKGAPLPTLPQTAGGLQLATFYSGEAAMRDIVRLHNNSFPLQEGLIARYKGDGGEATVWVSVSLDEAEAAILMEAMVTKMPGSPVFSEKDPFEAAGKMVYVVSGMGMEHYYWQDGLFVWWLAVAAEDHRAVLDSLLTK